MVGLRLQRKGPQRYIYWTARSVALPISSTSLSVNAMSETIIDDQDLAHVHYNGTWIRGGSTIEHDETVASSTVVGDSFIVDFFGKPYSGPSVASPLIYSPKATPFRSMAQLI